MEQDDVVDPLQHPRGGNIGSSYASGLARLSHRRRPRGPNEPPLSVRFLQALTQEIETIVTFFLKQQGEIAQELGQDCKQELQDIAESYYYTATSILDTDLVTNYGTSSATNSMMMTPPVKNHHANKQMRLDRIATLRKRYHAAGMQLYHLIQFVEVNVTGIRKILKKHDKLMRPRTATPWFFGTDDHPPSSLSLTAAVAVSDGPIHRHSSSPNHHRGCLLLKPLLNDTTITALAIMLEEALIQLALWQKAEEQSEKRVTDRNNNINTMTEDYTTGHHRTASSALTSWSAPPPPPPLSLPSMVRRSYTDPELVDASTIAIGSDGSGDSNYSYYADQAAYYRRLFSDSVAHYYQYFVSSPRTVTRSSVATASTSKTKRQVILQDDVLIKIQVARSRLQQTSEFVEMLAVGSMMTLMGEEDEEDHLRRRGGGLLAPTAQDSFLEDEKEWKELQEKQQLLEQEEPSWFHRPWISHQLNFLSTFLYMTNYYIVAPTSGSYAQKVGSKVALSSTIIGMTPFAALISTLLYSWWTSHSYKYALVFACVCSVIGNFCYAMGLPQHSLSMVLVGRLLNGFGSARSINRRYIADTYSRSERTAASAYFVTAGALGMAAGPAIASILDIATESSSSRYWQEENAPGWVMFVMWSVYLICLLLFFRDPPRRQHKHHESEKKEPERSTSTNGESRPLLQAVPYHQLSEAVDEPNILSNVAVMTTFLIYFVLKFMLECILSSSGTVTRYYFEWSGKLSGVYLAMLGLLMLPANYGVAVLSRTYEDKDLIIGMQVAMLVGCVAIINFSGSILHYNLVQYMSASVIIFLSASALEGPTMSLLSKTIPKSWSKGILNVGLLATEAGTFGRVVGDLFLSICATRGLEYLINSTFGTASVLCASSLAISYHFYDRLEPMDKDD